MESLGDKLRGARESKGYSFEHVGRETMIARRYLEALEKEDFAKFPGEPYLLGFLRNYGEYLSLDVNELLSLYRSLKIQEQPVPVEQLLHSTPAFPKGLLPLFIALPVLVLLAAIAYFVYFRPRMRRDPPPPVHVPTEYNLEEGQMERRLYKGDSILVPLGNEIFKVELREMDDPLVLTTPRGKITLNLGADTEADLNGDDWMDMIITLEDYDKASPSSGALVRFTTNLEQFTTPSTEEIAGESAGVNNIIFSSSTPYPFTLQASFQGYCMFRWDVDRRERNERYFSRTEELNLQAQNGIRLWVSNAAAVRFQVIGAGKTAPLEIGTAGEVVVTDIRWLRDNDGRFRLAQYRSE